ncbi:hypothetical protein [Arthrobacter sp. 18067]|uniref:hypothetical protein n=1 Tax=Arthrobacter sp. 18067 TaxID=2681413 RepID=UPI001358005F|nr:hypothetical protein [Arthrobacter sp. 18067]
MTAGRLPETFDVEDPATGEVLLSISNGGAADGKAALDATAQAVAVVHHTYAPCFEAVFPNRPRPMPGFIFDSWFFRSEPYAVSVRYRSGNEQPAPGPLHRADLHGRRHFVLPSRSTDWRHHVLQR